LLKKDPAGGASGALFAQWYDDGYEVFDEIWLSNRPNDLRAEIRDNGPAAQRLAARFGTGGYEAVSVARSIAWLGDDALAMVPRLTSTGSALPPDVREALVRYLARWSGGVRVRRRMRDLAGGGRVAAFAGEEDATPSTPVRPQRIPGASVSRTASRRRSSARASKT
jgi:hypothetical protein